MRGPRRPAVVLPLLVLVAGAAFFAWRRFGREGVVDFERRTRTPAANAAAAVDARETAGERDLAARSAESGAAPAGASDVAIEPTPEHGVPVVVVARGSGEPQPFALVTRIEDPWDDRPDAKSHRDVDWLLDHLGRRFRADARGFVRIPPSAGRLDLFARAGALAGYAPLDPGEVKARDDSPPKRIEVAPLANLRVRVVDPNGNPVAGVPLQLMGDGGGRLLSSLLAEFQSTAPDGLAEVRGASLLIDDGAPPGGLLVHVALSLRTPVDLRLTRAELDGTPRTLVVPATGSVELVGVDEHGNVPAVDESCWVILLRAPRRGSMRKEEQQLQIGDEVQVSFRGGRALLPFVELGDWIEADVDFGVHGAGFVQAAGPTLPGSSVRVEVPLHADPHVVAIRGRAVDPDGRPVARRSVSGTFIFRWIAPEEPSSVSVSRTTGADGSFEFSLRPPDESVPGRQWNAMKLDMIVERTDGGFDLRRVLQPEVELARRGGDLGTVVFERPPLLASGLVVEETGAPVQHASLSLMKKEASRFSSLVHESDFNVEPYGFSTRSDADGAFTILGDPGAGEFGIAVRDERYLSPPPLPIEPGATGLRIVVSRPAALLAHVLVDPGVPPSFVLGRIRVPRDGNGSRDAEQWECPDERGDLLFRMLPARTAELEIRAGCFGSPQEVIARFDAIPLAAGERTVDPRLQAIDLRGRFQSTHVVVVDEDGRPVPHVVVRPNPDVNGDEKTDERTEGRDLENGVGDLVTTGSLPPIVVEAEGFRPQRTELAAPETRVTLRRGLAVVVELDPSIPPLPESCFYEVTLSKDDFSSSMDADSPRSLAPDAPCELRVAEPGDHFLQLWLARYFGRNSIGANELKSGRACIKVEDSGAATKVRVTATPEDVKATLADLGQ